VYASGEPCAMCCGAMFWAGIRQVVYAASHDDITRLLGAPSLPISSREVLAHARPGVEVRGPLMGEQACEVLQRLRLANA
jgi:tRNA(adenine34) deaminase